MQRVRRARGTSSCHDSGAQWGSPHFTLQGCLSLVTYHELGAGTQQTACSPLSSGEGLRPKVGTVRSAERTGRVGGRSPHEGFLAWEWRCEPVPRQGAELLTEPCPLCPGSWRGGRAERWSSEPVGACTHLHTHLHTLTSYTGATSTWTRTYIYAFAHTHTWVLQRPDFQFQDPHPWLLLSC